jgi:hypothetical protein
MSETSALPSELSKLLAPADEDVKAIRSFLPGKVLGRTAVVIAALLAIALLLTPLGNSIESLLGFQLQPPWLLKALLVSTAVLIAGAQIVAEWHANRNVRRAQALAVKVEAVPEGYFRIGPYLDTAEDRAKFDRADRIHEKALNWLRSADATPLYLTGDSGSGKSSVLNAFVLPALRKDGWTIVEARAWQNPEAALTDAITKLALARKWRLGDAANLRGLLETLARRAENGLLLVLDQFEEFVILAGSERQRAFAAFIGDLGARPIKGLKLLLVVRSDYQTALEELGLPLLRQGENWIQVGRFTIGAGTKFMARSGLALQSDALDRVTTSACELDDSPGMLRPITLNVVGYVLSQGRTTAPSLDARRLVSHYIEQSVEQPAIRQFAPRVLKELVTEQGTKRPRAEKELVDQTRLRRGEVHAVMNGLSDAALARPLDAAQGTWELSHDFVARAVTRYLGRTRLDWPALVRGYWAPALFVLTAAVAAGAIAWSVGAADRAKAQLAELGIEVSSAPSGLEASASPRFRVENWGKVGSLLQRLTGLQSLNLFNTQVADLAPLKGLMALQTLDLGNTQVADLAQLKGLTALQTLDLHNTRVAELTALRDLTELRSLNLTDTRVADLGPLKDLTELQNLYLNGTEVADLGPLTGLTALQLLFLQGTKVADLAPLKDLTALQSLDLTRTQVAGR